MTDAEIAGMMGWRGPGAYTAVSLRKIRAIIDRAQEDSKQDALDAARYRKLRSSDEGIEFRDTLSGRWRSDCPSGDELDKVLDAAIAAEKEQAK